MQTNNEQLKVCDCGKLGATSTSTVVCTNGWTSIGCNYCNSTGKVPDQSRPAVQGDGELDREQLTALFQRQADYYKSILDKQGFQDDPSYYYGFNNGWLKALAALPKADSAIYISILAKWTLIIFCHLFSPFV